MDDQNIIGEVPLGSQKVIRVQTGTYKGKRRLDLRQYYQNDSGEFAPTQRGIFIPLDEAEKFKEIVGQAVDALST